MGILLDPRVYRLSDDGTHYEMLPEVQIKYKAAIQHQLDEWVKGNSQHTTNLPDGVEYECCPDFSCCSPELQWPKEVRESFVRASEEDRHRMLVMSLVRLTETIPKESKTTKILVIGDDAPPQIH